MIHYSKFIKYHGQMVTLTRISLNDARFFFNLGYDIYIVQDLSEFDKKTDLRLYLVLIKSKVSRILMMFAKYLGVIIKSKSLKHYCIFYLNKVEKYDSI